MSGFAAAFSSPMTITGSARVFDLHEAGALQRPGVVKFSTDGKFLIIGLLNFVNNNLSISGKLYADLSHITSGAATVLFLADVPDQVRILTVDGKLQMGFRDASGRPVAFTVPQEPATNPIGGLAGPGEGNTISLGELNGRGYFDYTYDVHGGTLDTSSINGDEFTLTSTGSRVALDTTRRRCSSAARPIATGQRARRRPATASFSTSSTTSGSTATQAAT